MLNDGEIDIAAADLTVTRERSTAVNFLPPLTNINEQLFLKNPTDAFHLKAFIEPLTKSSWLAVFVFSILVPPILAVIVFYGRLQKSLFVNCTLTVYFERGLYFQNNRKIIYFRQR